MSPMAICRDGDVVHLTFRCTEVKYSSFQICRTMLSIASICRLSDVLWLRVELDIAVNGLPMGKCPGVKASASLTSSDGVTSVVLNCGLPQFKSELSGTDEVVVAFSQLFGRKVVSTISLPLLIILRSVAL